VVAKVEWHTGELYARIGLDTHCGSSVITLLRLSCSKFCNNKVRLQFHALAHGLGYFMGMLALPKEVEHWSLTTLREMLVRIEAKGVRHSRYVTF